MPTKKKSLVTTTTRKRRTVRPSAKRPTTLRERNPEAADHDSIVLDPDIILQAAADLRVFYPKLTDEMCHIAHLVVQTGKPLTFIADALGKNRASVYSISMRADWADYLQAISMRALGWAASSSVSVTAQLLQHPSAYVRLAAASELMERGGVKRDAPRASALSVSFNFSVAPQAVEGSNGQGDATEHGSGAQGSTTEHHGSASAQGADGTHGSPPAGEGPSKTDLALGGGTPSHVMGGYAAIDRHGASEAVMVDREDAKAASTGGTVRDDFDW